MPWPAAGCMQLFRKFYADSEHRIDVEPSRRDRFSAFDAEPELALLDALRGLLDDDAAVALLVEFDRHAPGRVLRVERLDLRQFLFEARSQARDPS